MHGSSTFGALAQPQSHPYPQSSRGAAPSPWLTRALATTAAALLVCASSGFGAVYAGSLGAEHSLLLAGLSIAMALGLELAKPLSIAAAFEALRQWRLAQGTSLALLGLASVACSLTAELSLMAALRGDKVAERAAASNVTTNVRDRYARTKLDLDGLPSARLASRAAAQCGFSFRSGFWPKQTTVARDTRGETVPKACVLDQPPL